MVVGGWPPHAAISQGGGENVSQTHIHSLGIVTSESMGNNLSALILDHTQRKARGNREVVPRIPPRVAVFQRRRLHHADKTRELSIYFPPAYR